MTSTPSRAFQTDVRRTRGLQAGQILSLSNAGANNARRTADVGSSGGGASSSNLPGGGSGGDGSDEHTAASLAEEESRLNKKIDEHIRSLETSFTDLVSSMSVQDKNMGRLEMEAFMADYRADVMVRSVQGLSRLSKALRLSLLLSDGGGGGGGGGGAASLSNEERDERQRLEAKIQKDQAKCAGIVQRLMGGGGGGDAAEVIRDEPQDDDGDEKEKEGSIAAAASAAPPTAGDSSQPINVDEESDMQGVVTDLPSQQIPPQQQEQQQLESSAQQQQPTAQEPTATATANVETS